MSSEFVYGEVVYRMIIPGLFVGYRIKYQVVGKNKFNKPISEEFYGLYRTAVEWELADGLYDSGYGKVFLKKVEEP